MEGFALTRYKNVILNEVKDLIKILRLNTSVRLRMTTLNS